MLAWNFGFRMWTNPGPRCPVPGACRILCSNVWGLSKNLSDVTEASSQYDLFLCSEALVSDRRHISELLVPGFGRPVLLCRDGIPRDVEWLHMCEIDMGYFTNQWQPCRHRMRVPRSFLWVT